MIKIVPFCFSIHTGEKIREAVTQPEESKREEGGGERQKGERNEEESPADRGEVQREVSARRGTEDYNIYISLGWLH